jgi:hypothetical protein
VSMRFAMSVLLLSGLVLAGCASAGPPEDEGPTVPVFDEDDEKPCEYEVMHSISASIGSTRMGNQGQRPDVGRGPAGN